MLTEKKVVPHAMIRWIICFPVAFIAGAAAVVIAAFGMDESSVPPGYGFAAVSAWFAFVSIIVAKWIAPYKKDKVGGIMHLLSLIATLVTTIYFWENLSIDAIVVTLIATVMAGIIAWVIVKV